MSDFPSTVLFNGFRQFSVAGRPFPVVGGTVADSTASDPGLLERAVWPAARKLGVNTVFAPVTWQLLEPREGEFDFSVPDALFEGARRNGLKLVVIWYGAWKEGSSCYAPDWVKLDWDRFPLARPLLGRLTELLSPCAPAILEAEKIAYAALLGRLRALEDAAGGEPTVLMIQIEGGIGMVGGSRDSSGDSDARWNADVPDALVSGLAGRAGHLHPEIVKALGRTGSWSKVFGPNADGAFMAWQFATHVETLARAGAEKLPVPCFVSAWNVRGRAGEKPGGAPDGEMADVWDVAAPSVFRALPAPDAKGVPFLHPSLGEGAMPVLFPRIPASPDYPAKALHFFGSVLAGGVSSTNLGEESYDAGTFRLVAQANLALRGLFRRLGPFRSEESVRSYVQGSAQQQNVSLGDFAFVISWMRPLGRGAAPGGVLIVRDSSGAYWAVGEGARLSPRHDRAGYVTGILRQEEFFGTADGLVRGRVLNGDEGEISLSDGSVSLRRFTLYRRPV